MNIEPSDKLAMSNGVSSMSFAELVDKSLAAAYSMAASKKSRFHLIGGNDTGMFPYLYGAVDSGKDLVVMPDFIPRVAIEMTKLSLAAGRPVTGLRPADESKLPGGGNVVVFTSGTTGRPKPIVLSPHVLEIENRDITDQIGFDPEMDVFTPAPMLAAPTAYAMYLSVGASVHTLPYVSGNPVDVVKGFNASGAQVLSCTPSVLEKVFKASLLSELRGLKAIHLATSAVPSSLVQYAATVDTPVIDLYLSSETGPIAWRDLKKGLHFTMFNGVSLDYPDGELSIKEPSTYHAKGWYSRSGVIPLSYPLKNGDSVKMADGKIKAITRTKVKIAGFAVDPQLLVSEVMRLDGVVDAKVNAITSDRSDSLELLVETMLSEHEIRSALSDRLPWYYIPRRIVHV